VRPAFEKIERKDRSKADNQSLQVVSIGMRGGNMPSDDKKEPEENFKGRVRSFFGPQDPEKNKNALPPKAHFSIWYFLIAFLLFAYLQQYYLSKKVETIQGK